MTPLGAVVAMAGVTYLLRAIPLITVRRRITNTWILSFLHYVPSAVLTAMTIPAVVTATNTAVSGVTALVVAVALALARRSLMGVALGAALSVLAVEGAMSLM
ncbi:AzlD domain-containing protein [Dermatophilus congolensis]|uniref:Predicted membrane protein n=1 Tax=Dermatophilus congolensis TaxID=1863 RepID=A0A239V4X3_9MICO|nr:AzlD domain-containing protein [Dermatophilus congolensis]MBO3130228.1 AzlD domain-containing protein [Dermatophilus congolensis]MBO3131143.1 AzlD domain-containing protein [Dermatophilus congolensis]MBO3134698.1 AzlD domain-containing protein [Dermatophilus congolensis]MBO3136934.1 AzlD domain-containing protein [Dermatophilus congolensis]MBO3139181.1 AzlD domain-containing protein [Dermatophilus congolensis]